MVTDMDQTAAREPTATATDGDYPTVWSYPFSEPDRLVLHSRYAYLREHEPLARVRMPYGDPAWLVTGYRNVKAVLGDSRFSRAPGHDEPRIMPHQKNSSLLSMDPPQHTRLRTIVSKVFTARRVDQLRGRAEQVVEDLLDEMVATGQPADLVEKFSIPFPITIMCTLLGVPLADRHRFHVWTDAIISTDLLDADQVREHETQLRAYLLRLIRDRRRTPTDDLLGALVRARHEEDRLNSNELLSLAGDLLAVGYETTSSQIPNFVYTLLTTPGTWETLCADPELIPGAIEELLRYVALAPHALFPRYATEDVELEGGWVRAGEPVLVSLIAAARDPSVFADPERLNLTRNPNPHIAFSHGVHHCIGAQLARMELQVALAALVRRFPKLRIAVPEPELVWRSGVIVRGPKSFPIAW
jgi:cytochrome P450